MTTLFPTQVADLRRKIEAKYTIAQDDSGLWFVVNPNTWDEPSGNDHEHEQDAEAEMEAIIQDEVKAAMEAKEDVT